MSRERPIGLALTAIVAAAVGAIAAGTLGVATAEAPTTSAEPRTVSVQGVATESIEQNASAASATAVYRQGMADSVGDGLGKAQFLAAKVGAALGAVQSVVEDGGYIGCRGEVEYQGEQPDFPTSPGVTVRAPVTAGARSVPPLRRVASKRRKHRKGPTAKKASTSSCTLSTSVSLVYALS